MNVLVRSVFNIPKFYEDQPITGNVNNSFTAEFTMKSADETIVGTVRDVKPIYRANVDENEDPRYVPEEDIIECNIILNPIWTEDGPIDNEVTVHLTEVSEVKRVYIENKAAYGRKRPKIGPSDKAFCFQFPNRDFIATPDMFVKIGYRSRVRVNDSTIEQKYNVLGYVIDIVEDKVKILALDSYKCAYRLIEKEIKIDDIFSIFCYETKISYERPPRRFAASKDKKEPAADTKPEEPQG